MTGASDMVAPSGEKRAEDRPVANEPFVGGVAGRFVRDTGGANLARAQEGRLPDAVRPILAEANMAPEDITPVPSRYRGAQLTREEQLRWQRRTNQLLGEHIRDARESREWEDRSTRADAITRAISKAKAEAAGDVLDIGKSDAADRIEREERRKRRAS